MESDPASAPLPISPVPLCFNKDRFMIEHFKADDFISDCRKHVALEQLRDDLSLYLKLLHNSMVELINKDYADFVNLSSNLVGMDKHISNLREPLGELQEKVTLVNHTLVEEIAKVEKLLEKRHEIRSKKECLHRLINISRLIEKIEKLLSTNSDVSKDDKQLDAELIERVATEYNQLQFDVMQSKGLPLVEELKPRIMQITISLQNNLEDQLLESLETDDMDKLCQCLRTYATIDKPQAAEHLFRDKIIKEIVSAIVSAELVLTTSGLQGMYDRLLDIIPHHCNLVKEATSGHKSGREPVRGYDFLVNSVFPEISDTIDTRVTNVHLCSSGNPDAFHERYLISTRFIEKFELACGSQASVRRLRTSPAYSSFLNKFSLPVYFQMRFQEIAGSFEAGLAVAFQPAPDESDFLLHAADRLWWCINHIWSDEIFLENLRSKFCKLTLQHISRFAEFFKNVADNADDLSTSATITQIIQLMSDIDTLRTKVPLFYHEIIQPKMKNSNYDGINVLKAAIEESIAEMSGCNDKFSDYVVEELGTRCCKMISGVQELPRLFRRTNRDPPTSASPYVSQCFRPLVTFLEDHQLMITNFQKKDWSITVIGKMTSKYITLVREVLTAVKKMEDSLKRLKMARSGKQDATSNHVPMSDDNKIRQQVSLDVAAYGKNITSVGLSQSDVIEYKQLMDLVESSQGSLPNNIIA